MSSVVDSRATGTSIPYVAHDGEQFLVAWMEFNPTGGGILSYARRVDHNLGVSSLVALIPDLYDPNGLSIASRAPGEFLVTLSSSTTGMVVATRVTYDSPGGALTSLDHAQPIPLAKDVDWQRVESDAGATQYSIVFPFYGYIAGADMGSDGVVSQWVEEELAAPPTGIGGLRFAMRSDEDGMLAYDRIAETPTTTGRRVFIQRRHVSTEDVDGDGYVGLADNCEGTWNAGQGNGDGDRYGDACDSDDDNDGVCDPGIAEPVDLCIYVNGHPDNCRTYANPSQEDTDGDGIGDVCDDNDGDGVPAIADNCPTTPNVNQLNSDADTHGDACDNCPYLTNEDQQNTDGDSFGNACDNCAAVANDSQADWDGDGLGNACDTDADNDGVPDASDPCPFDPGVLECDGDDDGDGFSDVQEVPFARLDPNTFPGARELCDGVDNDLDGFVDEETGCGVCP